ncbi:MAG: alpha-isopropylmalate synthase regulatory domain-containing protein, partial [Candidatus Aminicenantaceae bacterium]
MPGVLRIVRLALLLGAVLLLITAGWFAIQYNTAAEDTAETVTGHGLSTNIIEASLEAYLAGLEKLLWHEAAAAASVA